MDEYKLANREEREHQFELLYAADRELMDSLNSTSVDLVDKYGDTIFPQLKKKILHFQSISKKFR